MAPRAALLGTLLLLAACASGPSGQAPGGTTPSGTTPGGTTPGGSTGGTPQLAPASFAALPGWAADDPREALAAFRRSCARPQADAPAAARLGVDAAAWRSACAAIPAAADANTARAFFESRFRPVRVTGSDGSPGLFTGYFEAEARAALKPDRRFRVPLYRKPPELPADRPWHDRAVLDGRGGRPSPLAGRGLELAWVEDRTAALELHIQGSGRLVLPDGRVMRIGFAAHNGQPYTAIGRELVAMGEMTREQVTWPAIKAWLATHPDQADALIDRNRRYVFFRELAGEGPIGAQGVPLAPGRSLAVDRAVVPLGLPVYVATVVPGAAGPQAWRRLMVAQDTGGAIKGPVRGDLFLGAGAAAADSAGRMNSAGDWWILVPRAAATAAR